MAENKTQANAGSVKDFLNSVEHDIRRKDAHWVLDTMQAITGEEPRMYGSSIVGFGSYTYRYASGKEGDWFLAGFSPRKANLVLYIMPGFSKYEDLLAKLGKHKVGKSCLYINKLSDVDPDILKSMIRDSVAFMRQKYGTA